MFTERDREFLIGLAVRIMGSVWTAAYFVHEGYGGVLLLLACVGMGVSMWRGHRYGKRWPNG